LVLALAGCGGGGGGSNAANGATPPAPPASTPPTPTTITLNSARSELLAGSAPVALTATPSASATVSWQLAAGAPGSLSATSGASVNYLPPANAVTTITPVTVTASAGGASQSIQLVLYPDPGAPGLSALAGSLGERAIIDGTGTTARFDDIFDVEADASGNLLVADLPRDANDTITQSVIRKVSAAGVVTTVSRLPLGSADGDAAHASMGVVISMAALPDGSMDVLDSGPAGHSLRTLHTDGSVSTLASAATTDQLGLQLLADRSGRVYQIAGDHINVINSDGSASVLAGASRAGRGRLDGQGSAAGFDQISAATIDSSGNLYVIDDLYLRRVTPAGLVTTLAGGATTGMPQDGSGTAASFGQPVSIAADAAGNVLVLDRAIGAPGAYAVRQVTPAGAVSTRYTENDPATGGELSGATVSPNTILRINSAGTPVLASLGQLQSVAASGSLMPFAGLEGNSEFEVDGPGASARFVAPRLLAADMSGNVYVIDTVGVPAGPLPSLPLGLTLRKVAPDGSVTTLAKDSAAGTPSGIVADAAGNVYVSAVPLYGSKGLTGGGGIYKITPDGKDVLFAGSASAVANPTSVDGSGTAATFSLPQLVGVDSAGNLYVNDTPLGASKTVYRMISPLAVVTTIASLPSGVGAAPDGYVYSVDAAQDLVYRSAPDGSGKTAVAGVAGQAGTVLGALPGGLDHPTAIVPTGPGSFAVISASAVVKLVLPH